MPIKKEGNRAYALEVKNQRCRVLLLLSQLRTDDELYLVILFTQSVNYSSISQLTPAEHTQTHCLHPPPSLSQHFHFFASSNGD